MFNRIRLFRELRLFLFESYMHGSRNLRITVYVTITKNSREWNECKMELLLDIFAFKLHSHSIYIDLKRFVKLRRGHVDNWDTIIYEVTEYMSDARLCCTKLVITSFDIEIWEELGQRSSICSLGTWQRTKSHYPLNIVYERAVMKIGNLRTRIPSYIALNRRSC